MRCLRGARSRCWAHLTDPGISVIGHDGWPATAWTSMQGCRRSSIADGHDCERREVLRCYRGTGCRSMGTRPRRRSRRNIQNNSTGTGTDRSCGEIDGRHLGVDRRHRGHGQRAAAGWAGVSRHARLLVCLSARRVPAYQPISRAADMPIGSGIRDPRDDRDCEGWQLRQAWCLSAWAIYGSCHCRSAASHALDRRCPCNCESGRMGSMSNTTRYGVLIDGRRGGYRVVFPDLPGCY